MSFLGGMVLPNTHSMNEMNGRVNLSGVSSSGGPGNLPGFSHRTTVEPTFATDALRGNWEVTPLAKAFFNEKNVALLQNAIRKSVYDKSGPKKYVIDDQSVDEMSIIMRTMYLQYAQNLPYDITGQIDRLNQMVLDWSVPHILSAVDHYNYYLNDISHMPVPLARSQHLSSAGTKTLPLNQFI